jgi:pyruvate/2-oxoglutarate dehydrogenase complex dihydrolipoamide acyltransferase (E2) component
MPPEEKDIDVGDSEESSVNIDIDESKPQLEQSAVESVQVSSEEEDLEEFSAGVQTRIDKLTKRFREEERQKQTAIQYAEGVRQENNSLKERLDSLDKGYQQQFSDRVESQIDTAKRLLKEAHEGGDVDKIVDSQEALSNLSYEKGTLARAQREAPEKQQEPQQPSQPQSPPRPPPDPKAESWASDNNWFGQDEVMTYAAFGVHRRLVEDEGFDPSSEAYYSELDNRMRSEFPHKFDRKTKSNGGSRKVASAEASASRNKSSGRRSVRLTPSQVAIAKRLNVPLEEYAKYVRD